jgi:hypothetical protein
MALGGFDKMRRPEAKKLTQIANFDNIEKFAQNTAARPVNTTRMPHSVHTAHQVRGHKAVGFATALVLDPKLLA